jgi:hypothetical protein
VIRCVLQQLGRLPNDARNIARDIDHPVEGAVVQCTQAPVPVTVDLIDALEDARIRVAAVEQGYPVPACDGALHEVAADELGAAEDQEMHLSLPLVFPSSGS